jgi:ribosomal protein S18
VGVRKCYGAEGKHIYGMLTREALLHIILSLGLAAIIIFAGRSIVENLLGVPFQTLLVPQSIVDIIAVILFVLIIWIAESARWLKKINTKYISYDKIELIKPERRSELIDDLRQRTGLNVKDVSIGSIDFLKDMALIKVFYTDDAEIENESITKMPKQYE